MSPIVASPSVWLLAPRGSASNAVVGALEHLGLKVLGDPSPPDSAADDEFPATQPGVRWLTTDEKPARGWTDIMAQLEGLAVRRSHTSALESVVVLADAPTGKQTIEALQAGADLVLDLHRAPSVIAEYVLRHHLRAEQRRSLNASNAQLRELVVRDPMTGLFNHAYLHEALGREISRAQRYGSSCSLVFVDLDNFKTVNDTLGHQAGDACLKTIAGLLAEGSRASDVIARYGGDEFAIVLPATPKAGAARRGEVLRQRVADLSVDELGWPPQSVSVGVATFPDDAADRTSLIAAADRAVYVAKRWGRNRVVVDSEDLRGDLEPTGVDHEQHSSLLAAVIAERQLSFAYQPMIRPDGSVYAYEALCRPMHPAFAGAGDLFAAAEHTGRVAELGRACREVALGALATLPTSCSLFLNVHPFELTDDLVDEASRHLAGAAGRVVFEVTDASQVTDYARVRPLLDRLRNQGFGIAMDNFGASYTGMDGLAQLRPDYLKLDVGVIQQAHDDVTAERLLRHMADFAHGEGMLMVAERVETAAERDAVLDLGCDLFQGFLVAPPGSGFPSVLPAAISDRAVA